MNIELTKEELTQIIDGLTYSLNGYKNKNSDGLKKDWQLVDKLKLSLNKK